MHIEFKMHTYNAKYVTAAAAAAAACWEQSVALSEWKKLIQQSQSQPTKQMPIIML